MDELLATLRQFDALRDDPGVERCDHILYRFLPSVEPAFDEKPLPAPLQDALSKIGVSRLYAHQGEAIRSIQQNEDVVLASPTASGKTLCFNIPMLDRLRHDPSARALMIYPMKALANDQRNQLEKLTRALGVESVFSWSYDGDTDEEHRKVIRKTPPDLADKPRIPAPRLLATQFAVD